MNAEPGFDSLERFAEIERLVAKVYFRFSHLFLGYPELRDFWWQMGMDEEQHSSILLACREIAGAEVHEVLRESEAKKKADQFEVQLRSYLSKGTRSISLERAFRIALEIETLELDDIYGKLLLSCGPNIARSMEELGTPASAQRAKLKAAILRYCIEPRLRAAAQGL